jgi:hypothetical protein
LITFLCLLLVLYSEHYSQFVSVVVKKANSRADCLIVRQGIDHKELKLRIEKGCLFVSFEDMELEFVAIRARVLSIQYFQVESGISLVVLTVVRAEVDRLTFNGWPSSLTID